MALILILLIFTGVVVYFFFNQAKQLQEFSVDYVQQTMLHEIKEKLKVATHSMALSLGTTIRENPNKKPEDIIRSAVDKIRFENDSSGYYFAYENTTNVALPTKKEFVGKDLANNADSNGVYYVRELQKQAQQGGGFVNYVFPKPGKGTVAKLGYAEMIPGTSIWIGTGIYIDNIDDAKKDINNNVGQMIRQSLFEIFIIILIILGVVIIPLSLIIWRSIISPLNECVAFANRVSDGDLNVAIATKYQDEVGIMVKTLNNMVSNLKKIVGSIIDSSDELVNSSKQISQTSEQLSEGASEQASATEQVSSSIEEMTANIQQNSDNSQQTEKISIAAVSSIKTSTQSAMEAINTMKLIAEKISIIGDIAAKTDLLAINASIEAARAGEHGKGFAVVASEVRKLAERSQIAAEEINHLSNRGVELADIAGRELTAIVPEIEKTSKLVQEISAASMEMDSGANQINLATQQLNMVTQQNATAAEELAASSKELNLQAENLRETISYFDLERDLPIEKVPVKNKLVETKKVKSKPEITKAGRSGINLKLGSTHPHTDDDYENF